MNKKRVIASEGEIPYKNVKVVVLKDVRSPEMQLRFQNRCRFCGRAFFTFNFAEDRCKDCIGK